MNEQEKLIGELADNQKTVFLGSVNEQGFPNIKAMLQTRKREGIRIFYFTTNTSSMRVKQYLKNPKACVYFCNQDTFIGAMLLGTIEILTDDESKQMIWREGDEIYYPKGVTDPDYCVLRFTTLSGRIYRNFHSINFEV
ncbi:MAG: pyridoxamine 5'-phosphate oxidase family protein [Bacteroidaceae bacterium]|nr:pyridoxamine 5'-phosphate oxidase family protein [Bacteroidaceae bacterium]